MKISTAVFLTALLSVLRPMPLSAQASRHDPCADMNQSVNVVQKAENSSNYVQYDILGTYARACALTYVFENDAKECDALMKAGEAFYKAATLQENNFSGYSPLLVAVDYAKAYDAFSSASVPCTGLRKDDAQRGADTAAAALHRLGIPKVQPSG